MQVHAKMRLKVWTLFLVTLVVTGLTGSVGSMVQSTKIESFREAQQAASNDAPSIQNLASDTVNVQPISSIKKEKPSQQVNAPTASTVSSPVPVQTVAPRAVSAKQQVAPIQMPKSSSKTKTS